MEYENNLILVEKPADKVALITLNNPPLNLVTLELSRELKETLFRLEQDDEVWVVVLTGSGEKAFCVGSDVKEFPLVWDDVIENPSFIPGYTGLKNLSVLAAIQKRVGEDEIRETLEKIGLEPSRKAQNP